MTVVTPTPGEPFTIRVYKRLTTAPTVVWANTYEVSAQPDEGEGGSWAANMAGVIVNWERKFHLTTVQFDRALVSTYVPDGQPYNPLTFVGVPFTGVFGQAAIGGEEPQPLQMTLMVRCQVIAGRLGRRLYRGVLLEADVTSPGGSPALSGSGLSRLGPLVNPVDPNGRLPELVVAAGGVLEMRGGPSIGNTSRAITIMAPEGVSIKKFNNRYFDRGVGTPP